MGYIKLSLQVVWAFLIVFIFAGCSASQSTTVSTDTQVSPDISPSPNLLSVTSADKIIGTWLSGSRYIRFDPDGFVREAHSLEKLDSQPFSINSYQFVETVLTILEISVLNVPSCGEVEGTYEITLLDNGNIQIVAIKDLCTGRAGSISGEYEPVR